MVKIFLAEDASAPPRARGFCALLTGAMKRQRKAEPAAPALRVLCLHGKGQCAEIFSQRVGALRKKARRVAQFEFVDAPFEEKLREGRLCHAHMVAVERKPFVRLAGLEGRGGAAVGRTRQRREAI